MTATPTPVAGTARGMARYAAIDGYRGFFVVLVLLYHVGVTQLAGGWIGINHFFVFSGFLIARMLIKEHSKTGRIDPIRFYRRRIRRIVPAMLVLVMAVLVHSWIFETAAKRREYGGDSFATLGFFLNWRLVTRSDAYFELFGHPSPLRHAWTLSVEEQFYLVAPLLLLLICRATRSRAASGRASRSGWPASQRCGPRTSATTASPTRRASTTAPTPARRPSWSGWRWGSSWARTNAAVNRDRSGAPSRTYWPGWGSSPRCPPSSSSLPRRPGSTTTAGCCSSRSRRP